MCDTPGTKLPPHHSKNGNPSPGLETKLPPLNLSPEKESNEERSFDHSRPEHTLIIEITPKNAHKTEFGSHPIPLDGKPEIKRHPILEHLTDDIKLTEHREDSTDEIPKGLIAVYGTLDAEAGRPSLSGADLSHAAYETVKCNDAKIPLAGHVEEKHLESLYV